MFLLSVKLCGGSGPNRARTPGHLGAVFWKPDRFSSERHSLDFGRLGGVHRPEWRRLDRRAEEGGWRSVGGAGEGPRRKTNVGSPCPSQGPAGLLMVSKRTQDFVLVGYGEMTGPERTAWEK